MTANHINQVFTEDYSHVNVDNHMRVFKDKWKLVCQCKRRSRMDDATKTITLHGKTYGDDVAVVRFMCN